MGWALGKWVIGVLRAYTWVIKEIKPLITN
jgi:hypothetical protein